MSTHSHTISPPALAGVAVPGCTYSIASNYNPLANVNNGSCTLPAGLTFGCMYTNGFNYNPNAALDNGTCAFNPVHARVVRVRVCVSMCVSVYVRTCVSARSATP